jgi:hypothetical protein
VQRTYSDQELLSAKVLQLCIDRFVDTDGESDGTKYDYSSVCPHCGVGRKAIGPLSLRSMLGVRFDGIASTLSKDEVLISEALVRVLAELKISGAEYREVCFIGESSSASSGVRHLVVNSRAVSIDETTCFGIDPFDRDEIGEYRCPLGHIAGLNLLSPLCVSLADWDHCDWLRTTQSVGVRRGPLVPSPLWLISQRLYKLLRGYPLPRCRFEVASVVSA